MLRQCVITLHLVLCQALFINTEAQEMPHFIEKLTTEEGLSSNNINDLAQTDDGFLWIATPDGLNRFDGTEVTQYFHTNNTNSLPHNYIYCLKKLPCNYLAIGTQAGLSFYNSNTGIFQNFYFKKNTTLDEFNNIITELEADANGNLWAVSKNCIFIFDANLKLKKIFLSPFTEADASKQRIQFVNKIWSLSNGDMLLNMYNGWHIYSNKTSAITSLVNSQLLKQMQFLTDVSPPHVDKSFTQSHVFKVFEKYFLCIPANKDSLFLYNESGIKLSSCFFPYNYYPYVLWSQQVVMIDSTNLLFLFHNYGYALISVMWQKNIPVINSISSLQSETHEYITALCDKQHNWWLATSSEGLQKISPTKQYFNSKILINDSTNKQSQYDVVSCNRYDNILWAGTYGDGFFEIDISSGKQQQHRFYKTGEDIWANFIWNIRMVSSDTLWIGTQAGMFWYSISSKKQGRIPPYPGKPSLLDSVPITTQFEDSHGLVWMGLGKGNGVCYFDSKQHRFLYYRGNSLPGYPLRYPLTILEDKNRNLWFTNDASSTLVYWNRNAAKFKTLSTPSSINKQSGFSGLWEHGDSILWLGSITGGLIKFFPSTNEAIIYGHDKGLANGHISSIYEDTKKRLWLATDAGLSCFDERTETFTNYSAKDGLPVSYTASFFYDDELTKRLYTGGKGTLFYLEPDAMNLNPAPQKPIIIAMRVNGEPYPFYENEPAKFSPKQNDITIQYTAVDLTNGAETKYAYKLIGEDTNWIMTGNQRQINFSHLAPGNYTFMVKAANNSGTWSTQTASVSFIIRAPFTQTVWFYILILAAIAGIFYAMYRFRLKQLLRTELVRSEISKNLHDEVGSHLTNISLSSLLAQKQLHNENAVSKLLERIYQDSQKVSESMREIVWSINPKIDTLGEALPRMLHYASELLEAKNIELQAEISTDVEHVKLNMQKRRDVYLIFKEAVNNMAKHSKATQAAIHFNLVNTSFVMLITDNGTGFDVTAPLTNNGLKNMQERAQSHHWKLQLDSNPNAGTTITLKVQIA